MNGPSADTSSLKTSLTDATLPQNLVRYRYEIADLLQALKTTGGSDLHLRVGYPPAFRIHSNFEYAEGPAIDKDGMKDLFDSITQAHHVTEFSEKGRADFALSTEFDGKKPSRFRVNVFRERGNIAIVMRNIPDEIIPLERLGVPKDAIERFMSRQRGLVLVVGPTGSGKTTTLASIIDRINENYSNKHILSIEAPIEFVHGRKKCIVSQREVGIDVPSFADAVRDSLRQDPNVILIGEMRDQETMEAALHAAETGHLVFATLHTTGAGKTIDRIIGAFPSKQQDNVRTQLSTVLEGVVSQLLVPRSDQAGRIAVFEVMVATDAIRSNIRDNKLSAINDAIQTGSKHGMVTMDSSLLEGYQNGFINEDSVLSRAYDVTTVRQRMREIDLAQSREQR